MSINWGWNFRQTLGYVTDGANEVLEDGAAYPHVYTIGSDSVTAGWQTGGAGVGGQRDRDNSIAVELAGIVFDANTSHYFQVDLPSPGNYDIYLAMGDATSANDAYWDLYDNATLLSSYTQHPLAGHFVDAAGNDWSAAAWPASQVKLTKTFASSTLKLMVTNGGGNSVIAHLQVVTGAAAATNALWLVKA